MTRQTIGRLVSVLAGAAVLFGLDQGLGLQWYIAIPIAVVVYIAVKVDWDWRSARIRASRSNACRAVGRDAGSKGCEIPIVADGDNSPTAGRRPRRQSGRPVAIPPRPDARRPAPAVPRKT